MNPLVISLPWPPSANSYWRHPSSGPLAGRHLISQQGRDYRASVHAAVLQQLRRYTRLAGKLAVTLACNPPDRRRRDLDNLQKPTLDALTHAQVWLDDYQIDDLRTVRDDVIAGGRILVTITELPETK